MTRRPRRVVVSRERQLALAVLACVADELEIPPRTGYVLTRAAFDGAPAAVRGAWTSQRVTKAFGGSWAEAVAALASDWDDTPPTDAPSPEETADLIIAVNVRLRRKERGMPVDELAQLADVATPMLEELEAGRRPAVPFVEIARIARALGVSLDAFLLPSDDTPRTAPGGAR